jgi:hypothetical protein
MKKVVSFQCENCASTVSAVTTSTLYDKELCELCHTTHIGNMLHYDYAQKHIVQAIAQAANYVTERLKHGTDIEWVDPNE